MSAKRIYRLVHQQARQLAAEHCMTAPDEYVVTVSEPTRNLEQNAKFHAMCCDIANQATWMGKSLRADQWKILLVSGHSIATGVGSEIIPGIEGEFVNIRESTAAMGKKRAASLIEYVLAWGSSNGVKFSDGVANEAN